MARIMTRGAVAFLAAVCLAHAARAAGRDRIKLRNGRTQPGTVTRDDAEGVELRLGGRMGTAEYSRDEVVEVLYAGAPGEYTIGIRYFDAGNYERAVNFLNMALERKHPKLLKQYILYYIAKTHQKSNEPKEAIAAFEGIVAQGAKSRFLYEAVESLIQLYSGTKRIEDAKGMLRKLPAPKTRARKLNRLMLQAMIEERAGSPAKAIRVYNQASRESGPTHQEEKAKAALGAARCTLALKRHQEAARAVKELIKSGKLGEHYAEAYVILGDALMATAKADDDYEAAILAYLRVPALYPGQEATEAKALFQAGRAYEFVTGKEEAKKRAAKLFAMLRDKYPNSSYAEEVRK